MGVPKRKRSKARRDKRFANKGLKVNAGTICQNCKSPVLMHATCLNCGFYKGKQVMVGRIERGLKREAERKAKEQRKKGAEVKSETTQE
jgi:large subunit ribosomal protein L32